MHKFTAKTEDGKDVEVILPDGYGTPDQIKSLNNNLSQTQRKLAKATADQFTREKALSDNDFIKGLFEAKGVPFDDETLDYKVPEEYKDQAAFDQALKAKKSEWLNSWESTEGKKLRDSNSSLSEQLSSSRMTNRLMTLEVAARREGVNDKMFAVDPFGNGSSAVHGPASLFTWSKDANNGKGGDVLMNGDLVVNDKGGNPVTPATYWKHFKETNHDKVDLMKEWFPDNRQNGSNFGGGRSGGSGGHTISADDARNFQKFQHAKNEAQKAGVQLQIVD